MKTKNSSKKRSGSSCLAVDKLKFDTSYCFVDLSNQQGDVDFWNRYFARRKRPRRESVIMKRKHVASAVMQQVAGNQQKKTKSRPRKRSSIGRKEMLEDYCIPAWDFSRDFLDNVADVSDDFRWGRAGTPLKKKTILNWALRQLDETEDLKRRYRMCQLSLFQLDQPFSRDREPQQRKKIPVSNRTTASVEALSIPRKSKKLRSLLPLRRRHKYGL